LEGWRFSEKSKGEGFKDLEKRRGRGFKGSRGRVEKDRGLDGWRVGGLAKNQKAKGRREKAEG